MFPTIAKFVISLLALVFATSVLFFGKTGWAAQQTVYRIGVITLFDDPAGIAQINTAIFAVNKINHHLAKRGSTVQLKVLFENGGCNQQDGLKAYMKLRPHTHFIEGGLCSGETLGYGSQAVLDGNFGLTATSSSDALEGPALAGNIKSLSYKNSAISAKLAEQLCAQSGSYAILTEDTDFTNNLKSQVIAGCQAKFLTNISFPLGTTDPGTMDSAVSSVPSGTQSVFLNTSSTTTGSALLAAIVKATPGWNLLGIADNFPAGVLTSGCPSTGPCVVAGMHLVSAPPISDPQSCAALAELSAAVPEAIDILGPFYTLTTLEAMNILADRIIKRGGDVALVRNDFSSPEGVEDTAGLSALLVPSGRGILTFGSNVFVQNMQTFPYVVQSNLTLLPPSLSCP